MANNKHNFLNNVTEKKLISKILLNKWNIYEIHL